MIIETLVGLNTAVSTYVVYRVVKDKLRARKIRKERAKFASFVKKEVIPEIDKMFEEARKEAEKKPAKKKATKKAAKKTVKKTPAKKPGRPKTKK